MTDSAPCEWTLLSVRLRIEGAPPELGEALANLLSGFTAPADGRHGDLIHVSLEGASGARGAITFRDARGGDERRLLDPVSASNAEYEIVRWVVGRERGHLVLHAAALSGRDGATLILGESGLGKTTLALLLRARGLELLSDDLTPLDPASGRVLAFPRSIHLDGRYPPELWRSLPQGLPSLPSERVPFPASRGVAGWGGLGEPVPVRRVLVLERVEPGGERTEGLATAEVAHALVRSVIRGPESDLTTLIQALAPVAREAVGRRLLSSSPEGALGLALASLAREGSGPR